MRLGRLMLVVVAGLAAAAPAAAAVPLSAGGLRIDWPLPRPTATLAPGAELAVGVRPSPSAPAGRTAHVVLIRIEDPTGYRHVVARARLRVGRFAIQLPDDGGQRYVLRVAVGQWRHRTAISTSATCGSGRHPHSRSALTLRLDRGSVRPGETVMATLVNHGCATVRTGYGLTWERLDGEGGWNAALDVPPQPVPLIAVGVPPGGEFVEARKVWDQMPPGAYRLVKYEHWSREDSAWRVASGVVHVRRPGSA